MDPDGREEFDFDGLDDVALSTLQNALSESPITINTDGISVQYKLAKATVEADKENASFKLELTTGEKLKVIELSGGIIITASYKDGPCGTIENRKSKSLNEAYDYYNYINSVEFIEDCME